MVLRPVDDTGVGRERPGGVVGVASGPEDGIVELRWGVREGACVCS